MTDGAPIESLSLLANLLPDGIVVVDVGGRIVLANDEIVRMLGCDKEEIVGSTIERFVPDRQCDAHVADRDRFFASHASRPMGVGADLAARRVDGTEFPVAISLRTVEIDAVTMVVAAVRDLTAQREVERANAILEIVRQEVQSALIVVEPTGRIAAVNPAATRLLGVDAVELCDRQLDATLLGESDVRRAFEECLSGRHVESPRLLIKTAWGEATPVSLTAHPVTRGRNDVVAVSVLLVDLSEQEASQTALQALQGRLEVTERLGGIGAWELNVGTGEFQMSRGLHVLLGLNPLDTNGTVDDLTATMEMQSVTDLNDVLARCIEQGTHLSMAARVTRADGISVWIVIEGDREHPEPLLGHDRVSGIVQDLTDQHEAMETLMAADRLKDEFLSMVSHELRTPLTVIAGFADHLQSFADEQTATYLSAMQRNAHEMGMMVDQLLDMSRVQSGQVRFTPAPHVLHEIVAETLDYAAPTLVRRHVVNATSQTVVGVDSMGLRRILVNLLSNAAKFSPTDSVITVSDRVDGGWVTVSVADEGIGIAPEDLETVFELFIQARTGRPTDVPGTGVGLTIVSRYVEMHGGRVWVESELGVGSLFRFTIPVDADATPQDGG